MTTNILEQFPELTYQDVKEYNPTAVIEFDRNAMGGGSYTTTAEQTSPIQLFTGSMFIFNSFELFGSLPKHVFEAISNPVQQNGIFIPPNFNLTREQDGFPMGNSRVSYGTYGNKPLGLVYYNAASEDNNPLVIEHDQRVPFSQIPIQLDYDVEKFYLYLRFNIYVTSKAQFIEKYINEGGQVHGQF